MEIEQDGAGHVQEFRSALSKVYNVSHIHNFKSSSRHILRSKKELKLNLIIYFH